MVFLQYESQMYLEIAVMSKALITQRTKIWCLSSMNPHMSLETADAYEALTTLRT